MTDELHRAYTHVQEVFENVYHNYQTPNHGITDAELSERKLGFLKFHSSNQTSSSDRLSQDLQELNCDGTNINYNLESNNTHFFLFDHKPNDWESIIRKRHDIENELSCALKSTVLGYNQWTVFDDDIPIVALLLGGNVTTLRAIYDLANNNELIVVFDPIGANGNLEGAIADAMLKRIYFRRQENDSYNYKLLAMELKWCLIWDKIDHARQNVFADHVFEKMSISQKMREFIKNLARTALFEALCRDNIHFVHLLMENGVSIKDLNIEQLTPEEFKMFCARILGHMVPPFQRSGTTAENKYLYLDLSWINFFASLANCICVLPFTLQGIFYQVKSTTDKNTALRVLLFYILLSCRKAISQINVVRLDFQFQPTFYRSTQEMASGRS
ncbi:unnamed protein product, partial [Rotaria magnacalcarata]